MSELLRQVLILGLPGAAPSAACKPEVYLVPGGYRAPCRCSSYVSRDWWRQVRPSPRPPQSDLRSSRAYRRRSENNRPSGSWTSSPPTVLAFAPVYWLRSIAWPRPDGG